MAKYTPFTEKAYPKLCAAHFIISLVLGVLLILGMKYSADERETNKTPYYFPAGVLIGWNVICLFHALFVAVCTRSQEAFYRHESTINTVLASYNFILNIADLWCFIGLVITLTLGACKRSRKCHHETQLTENILIAVAIAVIHFACFVWFIFLNSHVRVIEQLSTYPLPSRINKSKPPKIVIKRLKLEESDSSDSEDRKKEKEKTADELPQKKPLDGPVVDAGKLPFAVLAKSMAKFMQARTKNKIATQQGAGNITAPSKPPKKLLRRHESSPVGRLGSRDPPPLPSYETVIRNDRRQQKKSEIETNPYNLPPLPKNAHGQSAGVPDNLYSGEALPDTHIVVTHPKQVGFGIAIPPPRR